MATTFMPATKGSARTRLGPTIAFTGQARLDNTKSEKQKHLLKMYKLITRVEIFSLLPLHMGNENLILEL